MHTVRVELTDPAGRKYVVPSIAWAKDYLGVSRNELETALTSTYRIKGFSCRRIDGLVITNERELPMNPSTAEVILARTGVVAYKPGEAIRFMSVQEAARIAKCRECTIKQATRRSYCAGGWRWLMARDFHGPVTDWEPGMPVKFTFSANLRQAGTVLEAESAIASANKDEDWFKAGARSKEEWEDWQKVGARSREEWRQWLWEDFWSLDYEQKIQ